MSPSQENDSPYASFQIRPRQPLSFFNISVDDVAERALLFAAHAHSGQYRKYSKAPYIVHPIQVAELLKRYVGEHDKNMIAAAYLHDVIEDCNVTEFDLRCHFSDDVVDLVVELTNTSKKSDGNRATRKAMDKERLSKISNRGKTIKLADIICNMNSIVDDDPDFAVTFMREKKDLMPILDGGSYYLYILAEEMINEWEQTGKFDINNVAYFGRLCR